MDKSKIKLYTSEEEAKKNISNFEYEWNYNPLEYSAMHKTGFKLALREDQNGDMIIVSQNFTDWAHHMCHDEGLTGREVSIYKERLVKEFKILTEQNIEKMNVFDAFLPYMSEVAAKNKYKS